MQLERSTVSEVEGDYQRVLEQVSDQVAAKIPEGAPHALAVLRASEAIVKGVKRILAQKAEAADVERMKGTEAAKIEQREAAEKGEKTARLAGGGTGQQKGRGANKLGSAIATESEKSTRAAFAKDPDNPLLRAWHNLDARERVIKAGEDYKADKTAFADELADIAAKKQQINEGRGKLQDERLAKETAAKAAIKSGEEKSAEVKATEKKAKEAIARQPLNASPKGKQVMIELAREHLRRFIAATRDVAVHKVPSRRFSSAENLIIYARSVANRKGGYGADPDVIGSLSYKDQGATEFLMAQAFYDADATEELYGLITNESIAAGRYHEQLGKDEAEGSEKALHEDETDVARRGTDPHEIVEVYDFRGEKTHARPSAPAAGRKGGSAGATERVFATETRELFAGKGPTDIALRDHATGELFVADVSIEKASSLLRAVNRAALTPDAGMGSYDMLNQWGGYVSVLRSTLTKHLIDLVGDHDVIFISQADMQRTFGGTAAAGVYTEYSDEQRAGGIKPVVFIDESLYVEHQMGESGEYAHTLVHELVHAATVQGYRHNLRGTQPIIDKLAKALKKHLLSQYTEAELKQRQVHYGFTNGLEFIAEAFSNPAFQRMLANHEVPPSIRREIQALKLGRAPTWFEAVSAAVSNAVGMFMGSRGNTYMETMVALYPSLVRTSQGQLIAAKEEARKTGKKGAETADHALPPPNNVLALNKEFSDRLDGMHGKVKNLFTSSGIRLADRYATTGELMRKRGEIFRWH